MIRLHCIHWVWPTTLTFLLWWIGTDKEALSFDIIGLMSVIMCVCAVWESERRGKCRGQKRKGIRLMRSFYIRPSFLIGFPLLLLLLLLCECVCAFWSSNSLTSPRTELIPSFSCRRNTATPSINQLSIRPQQLNNNSFCLCKIMMKKPSLVIQVVDLVCMYLQITCIKQFIICSMHMYSM